MNVLSRRDSLVGVIYDCISSSCVLANLSPYIYNHVCVVSRETRVHQGPQGKVALLGSRGSEGAEGTLELR